MSLTLRFYLHFNFNLNSFLNGQFMQFCVSIVIACARFSLSIEIDQVG